MLKKIEALIPGYSRLWLLLVVITNFTVYIGTRLLVTGRTHYSLQIPLDEKIPFLSFFVVFYVLAFAQWVIGYLLIARSEESFCRALLRGEIMAKLVCGLFFLLLPTTIVRPQITGSSVFDRLTAFIYQVDAPNNLFPSIHCLESWVVYRSSGYLKAVPRWYRPVSLICTLFVFASTVLLKQHVLLDIPGAVLLFELTWFLSRKWEVSTARSTCC